MIRRHCSEPSRPENFRIAKLGHDTVSSWSAGLVLDLAAPEDASRAIRELRDERGAGADVESPRDDHIPILGHLQGTDAVLAVVVASFDRALPSQRRGGVEKAQCRHP
jgi:hypothetical protein